MKKILLLLFALSFMTVEAQVQRGIEKSDIRRGTNVTSSEETIKSVRKRPGKVKYGRMYISRISSQGEIPIITDRLVALIAKDANLTKVDAGNALNAILNNLSELISNEDNLKLSHFKKNDNVSDLNDGSTHRIADLKKLADELVNLVSNETNLTKTDAGNALNAFVANLSSMLREKGDVIHVTVAENKALSITMSDTDADGDGVLDVRAVKKVSAVIDADSDGFGD